MSRIKKLHELLQQMPNDNFLRHALALEYIKEGNDADAGKLFEAILNDSPNYIGSYYHLGKLLERSGEFAKAIECYEKGMAEAKKANDNHTHNELQAAFEDIAY